MTERRSRSYNDKLSRLKHKATKLGAKMGFNEKFRSGLEVKVAQILRDNEIGYKYEQLKIKWIPLPIERTYNPDFHDIVTKSKKKIKLILEPKGRFMPDDMAKHLAVKMQHPEYDIRFIFQNSRKWYRAAKTRTYRKWCEENGFKCCDIWEFNKVIQEWIAE